MLDSSRDSFKKSNDPGGRKSTFKHLFKRNSFLLVFKPFLQKVKDMKPECKVLKKAFETLSTIQSKNDSDFPEMLSFMYLLAKGYWELNDDGEVVEVKEPPYTSIALLNAMREITKRLRNGKTIEEIVNEKELCGDVEEI
jgi:hypothetical protein